MPRKSGWIVAIALVLAMGCGGGSDSDSAASTTAKEAGSTESTEAADASKGIGPISHVDLATLDMSASTIGSTIFETKCSACHKLEERYIGPALNGVTERRRPEWILNMILNTDVMVQQDPTARGLLAEYLAPMTNQNLSEDEARAVLAFLLKNDRQE